MADRRDRRNVRLFLTAEGRRLLSKDPMGEFEKAVSVLPAPVRKRMSEDLARLLDGLLAARRRQPFGQCSDCRYFARNHPEGAPHRCLLLDELLSESDSGSICFEQTAA